LIAVDLAILSQVRSPDSTCWKNTTRRFFWQVQIQLHGVSRVYRTSDFIWKINDFWLASHVL